MAKGEGDDHHRGPRGEPVFLLPPLVTVLVGAMIVLVVLRSFLSPAADQDFVYAFGFVPDRYAAGGGWIDYPGGGGALAWTFLTYAFLHEGWAHLLINAAMLAALARPVLERTGSARFLAFFVAVTVGGALGHLAVAWGSEAPMIGASGAVSGLLGALLRFVFRPGWLPAGGVVESLKEPRVRGVIAALVVMNVALVVFGTGLVGGVGGSVAWGAHLGGFLVGFLGFSWFEAPRPRW